MDEHKRLIDLDKIKPMDFPSVEMDGLDVVRYLETLPTVDAVPVMRCKDCEHWNHQENGMGECTNERFYVPGICWPTMGAEDFCSCGERRADHV